MKRSTLKDRTNTTGGDEEHNKVLGRARELYQNWLAGAQARAKMLDRTLLAKKNERLRDIDQVISRMDPDILNMKMCDWLELAPNQEEETAEAQTENNDAPTETNSLQQPMEESQGAAVIHAVDQVLFDLQNEKTGSGAKEKTSKKRKATVQPTRKMKQKASKSTLRTPCNSKLQEDWKTTPFLTPAVSRLNCDTPMTTVVREGTAAERKLALPKVQVVSERGSPVHFPSMDQDPQVHAEINKYLAKIKELIQGR